ncbi:MAG: bifunctional 2-polyprenyl-6-hydroxyphenol methylase/3-demethylubiquinol 3-O-methyltransferase UbiG, partial [Pseudomonadota bacterium]
VEHYTQLAETWWDPTGPFWPLHTLNELRVSYIREQLRDRFQLDQDRAAPLAGLSVLDVGCGGGILSESMAKLGAEVTGIDVVERNIGIAKRHSLKSGIDIDYRQQTASDLASQGSTFDVVLNMEVVEHVADVDGFMSDCCRLVRPGGSMFVATINRNPVAGLVAIFGAEYVLRWLPKGTHRYRMLRKPEEIIAPLEAHGFQVETPVGVRVNPFNRRMSIISWTGVNYMLRADLPE